MFLVPPVSLVQEHHLAHNVDLFSSLQILEVAALLEAEARRLKALVLQRQTPQLQLFPAMPVRFDRPKSN